MMRYVCAHAPLLSKTLLPLTVVLSPSYFDRGAPPLSVCLRVCGRCVGRCFLWSGGVCVCAMSSKTPQRRTHTPRHPHKNTHNSTRNTTHTHTTQKKDAPLCPNGRRNHGKGCVFFFSGHLVLGLASGLEAFSREPPCDGFGALAVRQTPETRGTAWEFLSYYPILPSRYLRDPFTISLYIHTVFVYGDERTKYYPPLARPKNDPTSALHG